MSGRMLALALTLALSCALAAGCAAGLEAPPIFVTLPPAIPGSAGPQAFTTAAPLALPMAALPGLLTESPQAVSTAPVTQTHVINVPGQPFTFRVPAGWTVQEVASVSPGMVLTADWTSPDKWDSPPPAGVVAHVAAVGAQPVPADMTDADLAQAAQPDQLALELKVMLQNNCGSAATLDTPLPIQIAGQPGVWMHCRATVDGRALHLIAASAVRGRSTVALMGLATDPAPWSELAPVYEAIIKSIQATD